MYSFSHCVTQDWATAHCKERMAGPDTVSTEMNGNSLGFVMRSGSLHIPI